MLIQCSLSIQSARANITQLLELTRLYFTPCLRLQRSRGKVPFPPNACHLCLCLSLPSLFLSCSCLSCLSNGDEGLILGCQNQSCYLYHCSCFSLPYNCHRTQDALATFHGYWVFLYHVPVGMPLALAPVSGGKSKHEAGFHLQKLLPLEDFQAFHKMVRFGTYAGSSTE